MKPRPLLAVGSWLVILLAASAWMAYGPARFGGAATYVTTHGLSMEPAFRAGDLAIVKPADGYVVGDVVAYESEDMDTVVLHRIVDVSEGRYTLQGDNNTWLDLERPTPEQVVGKQLVRVPQGGIWMDRLTSPAVLSAVAFLLLAGGGAIAETTRRHRRRDRQREKPVRATTSYALMTLPSKLQPVVATVVGLAVTGCAIAAVAWSQPTTEVISGEQSSTSTLDFSYTAQVRPSPAYDGTTVTDPQPVFRTVADSVDVGFRYDGEPGTVTVDAELSTAGGWSSTVQLAGPVAFEGERYDGTVRLDLASLQARAEAASAVTGLPAQSVAIAVVPRITPESGGTIAPRLELTLDALTLRLSGADTAAVDTSTMVSGTRTEPATLTAAGRSVSVERARTVSVAVLALALLGGITLMVLLRRMSQVTEAQRIQSRYAPLLLPVLPMASAPGRAVVDVSDIASLARIAERYGLLVLHWSRSGIDTYVVQDELTTYRFRSSAASDPVTDPTVNEPALELDA